MMVAALRKDGSKVVYISGHAYAHETQLRHKTSPSWCRLLHGLESEHICCMRCASVKKTDYIFFCNCAPYIIVRPLLLSG